MKLLRILRDLLFAITVVLAAGLFFLVLSSKLVAYHSPNGNSKQIYHYLSESVVRLQVPAVGGGTGFLVKAPSGKTVVLSNRHVCEVSEDGYMYADRMKSLRNVKVRILEKSPDADLCVLETVPGRALDLGKPTPRFSTVYILGHPKLYDQTTGSGIYLNNAVEKFLVKANKDGSCPEGSIQEFIFFGLAKACVRLELLSMTTIPTFGGNSGSPVMDDTGKVVGIINSANDLNQGAYVPVQQINQFLAKY